MQRSLASNFLTKRLTGQQSILLYELLFYILWESKIRDTQTISRSQRGAPLRHAKPLPKATRWELEEACKQLTEKQAKDVLVTRLLPFILMPGETLYAAGGQIAQAVAANRNLEVVALADEEDMLLALQTVFSKKLLEKSISSLAVNLPEYSASKRVSLAQGIALLLLACGILFSLIAVPILAKLLISAVFSVIFLSVVFLRMASILPPVRLPPRVPFKLCDKELPFYTVLVPLFQETEVVEQLLRGLRALNYPTNRLDIKLILEETDSQTRNALAANSFPPHMEVIIVPNAKPQTKPKALNYALQFSHGDLIVIFDAEDIPEPDQLRKAAEIFAKAPPETVCLQASLAFYNASENWLTRQFAIEYAVLFDFALPLLASWNLPLPLGGTSNHFRRAALLKLGAWDPYNVTEDADLGIRLARFGWRADVFASSTYEEANNDFSNWVSQRARWLKGWIQTWFVHMRNPARLWKELGAKGFVGFQVVMAGIVISTLVHPFFLAAICWSAISGTLVHSHQSKTDVILTGVGISVFLIGYGVMLKAGFSAVKRRNLDGLFWSVLAMPLYWLLISLSGWLAVKQFITHPFQWNKTRHGLSKKLVRPKVKPPHHQN